MATVAMETAEMSNIFKMLQTLWNLILLLTGMYRWDFWLWNFQNGCRCHGNSRNVKLLTMLLLYWKFTERYIAIHRSAFTVKLFWNGCRLVAMGGRVTSAIACNGNSSYYYFSCNKFCPGDFSKSNGPMLMELYYSKDPQVQSCRKHGMVQDGYRFHGNRTNVKKSSFLFWWTVWICFISESLYFNTM
mgnify:CR=1 FL=1